MSSSAQGPRASSRRIVLADDLTGTLEIGAILKQAGRQVQIGIGSVPTVPADCSVVTDCQTRRLPPSEALARYGAILEAAGASPVELYLKVDSTLRGNVAAAIRATLAHYRGRNIVFCPAYPAQGRTVVRGQVFVHGEPLRVRTSADESAEPLGNGVIGEALGGALNQAASATELIDLLASDLAGTVLVCDARSEQDLRDIWQAVEDSGASVVMAGSAGLMAAKCARLDGAGLAVETLAGRQWVVACGSMNPATRRQLEGCPWMVLYPPATAAEAEHCLMREGGGVLATPPERSDEDVTPWLVSLVQAVRRKACPGGLIVFGGDTAASILAACGIRSLEPAGEILPGVPCSWVELEGAATPLITKAGGFGAPDLLRRLISEITKA